MGGLTNRSGNMTFLKIAEGKIRTKAKANDPGAEYRKVEVSGKVYEMWEYVYTDLEGVIQKVEMKSHETFGDQALVTITDGDQVFGLTLPEKSGNFRSFAYLFPNLDFSKEVVIKPYSMAVKDKDYKNTGITMYQDGEKVLNYFKDWDKDNEKSVLKNGLEAFDFGKVKGNKQETEILKIRVLAFLKESVESGIQRLNDFNQAKVLEEAPVKETTPSKEDDDLPY